MSPHSLRIEAPSRLHFGLLAFGHSRQNQFGGAGLMIRSPGLSLVAETADRLVTRGPMADRMSAFANRWKTSYGSDVTANVRLHLERVAPQHSGLGTGTQLGLSVATALCHLNQEPFPDARSLALSVGRAVRSSVGTYGFIHGGLIIDGGKSDGQPVGRLKARLPLPDAWRVVLISPNRQEGLSGDAETIVFRQTPAIPMSVTDRLVQQIDRELLPAAREGNLNDFGEAVYHYGHEAGMCFAHQQGGPFATERIAACVHAIRRRGIRGVGQSSWGPTLFALTPNTSAATELIAWAQRELPRIQPELRFTVSEIANEGARHTVDPTDRLPCRDDTEPLAQPTERRRGR